MTRKNQTDQHVLDEAAELKSRLAETEETLQAIRQYMVDAFVVNRENGIEVVTLNHSEIPYRMMVESMNEGAVTLIPDGTIFYSNSCFGKMVETDCEKLIGTSFHDLIQPEEQSLFDAMVKHASPEGSRAEFCLKKGSGRCLPVQLSLYLLGTDVTSGIAVIATDINERVQAEEKIRLLSAELTKAEQEERQRISQVLHDDLQQRLFAIKAQLSFLSNVNWKEDVSKDAYFELDLIHESLSEAIAITRNLSIDLSPTVLQGKGLTEAMTWLSFRMKEQYGLQVDLDIKEDFDRLDNHMRMLLFQAVRELLFNIVKHAGTLQSKVTLEKSDGHGRILVSDEGKGFDVDAIMNDPTIAHGLLIIRDRLNLLGCRMRTTSNPGQGTNIVIELP
jgi:PAS domain S-box-containing protein